MKKLERVIEEHISLIESQIINYEYKRDSEINLIQREHHGHILANLRGDKNRIIQAIIAAAEAMIVEEKSRNVVHGNYCESCGQNIFETCHCIGWNKAREAQLAILQEAKEVVDN